VFSMVIRPRNKLAVCLITAFWSMGLTVFAQSGGEQLRGPAFVADEKFKGSSLDGWHKLGQADWSVENGELLGNGSAGSGWLVLDRSYQDAGFYAAFRCKGACDTGVLLRMTKTADGMNGTYYSVKGGTVEAQSLTLAATGNIVARQKLRDAGGQFRYAPPMPDPTAAPVATRPYASEPAPPGVTLPITMPRAHVREGEWNELEVMLDADIIRGYLNDAGRGVSAATNDDDLDAYGPIALYVGKGTEVRFKDSRRRKWATAFACSASARSTTTGQPRMQISITTANSTSFPEPTSTTARTSLNSGRSIPRGPSILPPSIQPGCSTLMTLPGMDGQT
jgi:hypothetical protein